MYTIILILLLGSAVLLFVSGLKKQQISRLIFSVCLAVITILFFWFMSFWGEKLWFQFMGQDQRFWTEVLAKILFLAVGAVIGWLIMFILTSFPTTQTYEAVCLFVSPSIQHASAPTRFGTSTPQSMAPARWPLRSNSTSRATS